MRPFAHFICLSPQLQPNSSSLQTQPHLHLLIPNPSHKPRPGHKDALTHHLQPLSPPPPNKCPSAMRKRSGRRATVHPEREAAGVWNVKCAFSANGVTHLVLIKDLATSQPLPSELLLLEQVKGSPRKKWLEGVCRQPVRQRGGEEGNRAGGRERQDAAFLRAPLSAGDSAGCRMGGGQSCPVVAVGCFAVRGKQLQGAQRRGRRGRRSPWLQQLQ